VLVFTRIHTIGEIGLNNFGLEGIHGQDGAKRDGGEQQRNREREEAVAIKVI